MAKLPRLSPLNIQDVLIRARFYRELQQKQSDSNVEWDEYEVSLDELLMPELISLRYYGTQQLKSVVTVCARLDDPRKSLQAGSVIRLPPAKWVRQRIRYYMEVEGSL